MPQVADATGKYSFEHSAYTCPLEAQPREIYERESNADTQSISKKCPKHSSVPGRLLTFSHNRKSENQLRASERGSARLHAKGCGTSLWLAMPQVADATGKYSFEHSVYTCPLEAQPREIYKRESNADTQSISKKCPKHSSVPGRLLTFSHNRKSENQVRASERGSARLHAKGCGTSLWLAMPQVADATGKYSFEHSVYTCPLEAQPREIYERESNADMCAGVPAAPHT